jgi:hypothetical protein
VEKSGFGLRLNVEVNFGVFLKETAICVLYSALRVRPEGHLNRDVALLHQRPGATRASLAVEVK